MDSGNLRSRFHLVVEVPELVRYNMDMAGSFEVKVVEDRHVHRSLLQPHPWRLGSTASSAFATSA